MSYSHLGYGGNDEGSPLRQSHSHLRSPSGGSPMSRSRQRLRQNLFRAGGLDDVGLCVDGFADEDDCLPTSTGRERTRPVPQRVFRKFNPNKGGSSRHLRRSSIRFMSGDEHMSGDEMSDDDNEDFDVGDHDLPHIEEYRTSSHHSMNLSNSNYMNFSISNLGGDNSFHNHSSNHSSRGDTRGARRSAMRRSSMELIGGGRRNGEFTPTEDSEGAHDYSDLSNTVDGSVGGLLEETTPMKEGQKSSEEKVTTYWEDFKDALADFAFQNQESIELVRRILLAIGALLLIIVGLFLAVNGMKRAIHHRSSTEMDPTVYSNDASTAGKTTKVFEESINDFPQPTATATATGNRLIDLKQLVIDNQWSTATDVHDLSSPQFQAVEYLAVTDPRQLSIQLSIELMERYALAVLYYATDGAASWKSDLHWMSTDTDRHVCDWNMAVNSGAGNTEEGTVVQVGIVDCTTTTTQQVQSITIPSNNVTGTLPNEIGLLQELQHLNLYNNHLTGTFPEGMRLNGNLKSLVLHKNDLSGTIPKWLCTSSKKLETIHLGHNDLTGALPKTMQHCKALRILILDSNTIDGTLEPLAGLEHLELLSMDDNVLNGTLTDALLDTWPALEVLDLGQNSLTGDLPNQLLSHMQMEFLDLHSNLFQGELPSYFRMGAPLQFLALHDNKLQGHIRGSLFSLEQLQHLDLSKNDFTGDMPTHIGTLTKLEYFYMSFNRGLELGEIPTEIGMLKKLQDVSFQATNRNGPIPFDLEHCKELKKLDLNDNHLTGELPLELGGLHQLEYILVQDNEQLTGTIPSTFTSLRKLHTLVLYNTGITGGASNVCAAADNSTEPTLKNFIAQCDKFVDGDCPCCTSCCRAGDIPACGGMLWYGQMGNPVSNSQFLQNGFQFHEVDLEFHTQDKDAEFYNEFGEMQEDMASKRNSATGEQLDEDDDDTMQYTPSLPTPTRGGDAITNVDFKNGVGQGGTQLKGHWVQFDP